MSDPDNLMSTPAAPTSQTTATTANKRKELYVNYLTRRETHTSRAIISVFVAASLIFVFAYLMVELVLSLLHRRALLIRPGQILQYLANLGDFIATRIPASVIAAGVAIAIVGLFLICKAILPGALKRHVMQDERMAIVIDDNVIAAAISATTRRAERLDKGQVTTTVKRRQITPRIIPTSGRLVDGEHLQQKLQSQVDSWQLKPAVNVHVHVESQGVVSR